jgi:hypothetical protein
MTDEQKKDWLDLAGGLGLLVEDYSQAIEQAMHGFEQSGDPEELEHVTALAICRRHLISGSVEPFIMDKWQRLSADFHDSDCQICKNRKIDE